MSYYIVVPSIVRHSKEVSEGAKLLFGDIAGLSNKIGYCFASNRTLSKIAGKNERQITRYLTQLENAGFIRREGNDIPSEDRKIYLTTEVASPLDKKDTEKVDINVEHTNISLTNTLTIKDVSDYFISRRLSKQLAETQAHQFIEYHKSRGEKLEAKGWKRFASTWISNGVRFGSIALLDEGSLDTFTLEQIETPIGSGLYDRTKYRKLGNGRYERK